MSWNLTWARGPTVVRRGAAGLHDRMNPLLQEVYPGVNLLMAPKLRYSRFRLDSTLFGSPSPLFSSNALTTYAYGIAANTKKIKTHLPAMDLHPVYFIILDLVFVFHLIPALSANSPSFSPPASD